MPAELPTFDDSSLYLKRWRAMAGPCQTGLSNFALATKRYGKSRSLPTRTKKTAPFALPGFDTVWDGSSLNPSIILCGVYTFKPLPLLSRPPR